MSDEKLANRHFLIVDDEEFIRRMVRRYLNQAGAIDIAEAKNGSEAIEEMRGHDMVFDCVITDVQMDPINGIELLKAIRTGAYGLKRNTPVLVLTTFGDAQLVAAALALDADGFVVKPVARDMLVDRIFRVIAKRIPIRDVATYRSVSTPTVNAGVVRTVESRADVEIVDGETEDETEARLKPSAVIPQFAKRRAKADKPDAAAQAPAKSAGNRAKETEKAEEDSLVARAVLVPLQEVRPNSILAQNIYAADHKTLLLGMATTLNEALLVRLKDLRAIHASFDALLVVAPD